MKKIIGIIFSIYLLLIPILSFAQSQATLRGTILDTNEEPLAGANVLLMESSQGAASDADGRFEIDNIEPGSYTLRITFVGYQTLETDISFESGEVVDKNFTLQPRSVVG
ncbi:MAG TPA: carboxypeptidase-like regulatory domain-containing protein [Fodinibius sp.]|nr:carboxypeptidase-like regulatory domain-containing protein [Fodinibius sp.]